MIAVNLGCGTHVLDNWVNLDNSPNIYLSRFSWLKKMLFKFRIINKAQFNAKFNKGIILRDLRKPLPFNDNSVDFVYSSHFLEHLSKQECDKLLKEIYRILKKGAILRLVVPDLDFYMNQYHINNTNENKDIAADIFMEGLNIITKSRDPHMWMYNRNSLSRKLRDFGFENVTVYNYKEGECVDINFLDYLPETSLHIEAKR